MRDEAVDWLKKKKQGDQPWMLYVGFWHPHFPFLTKKEHWDYYDARVKDIPDVAKPPFSSVNEPLKALRTHFNGDSVGEETIRKSHVGYYSLITEMDENIGRILSVLEEQGISDDMLIIYTSDHGEQLGNHGLWFKCCMFEESSRIPLIIKGPGLKQGAVQDTLVSLVHICPPVCEALQTAIPENIQGKSLMKLAAGTTDMSRDDFVFSEYHARGMPVGMFMIRWRQYKYVYYTGGYKAQLFDLDNDPNEMHDLNKDDMIPNQTRLLLDEYYRRAVCDPNAVDERARAFQKKTRINLGVTAYTQADPASAQSGELFDLPVPLPEYMVKFQ